MCLPEIQMSFVLIAQRRDVWQEPENIGLVPSFVRNRRLKQSLLFFWLVKYHIIF